ncbi:hypothetical protein CKK33_05600 [Mucilaginibacter sp. MD40]|uniref:hypothetical protein n=1 Tax=Mucilaginibacter sp. MD40 TaxID=2029590 RepID=UPI000BACDB29|nr:hypothetical protein [Mucilaginibacter sp. MD40]PAW92994.1 hypothetical protein CKK33_05600 [Mucilaginibacter sp. MD40]
MKTTIILFAIVIKATLSYSQIIHSNELIKITLPKQTTKISKQQLNTFSPQFNPIGSKANYIQPYNYQVEDFYLGLSNVSNGSIVNDLERMKRFQDDLNLYLIKNGNKTYRSFIKKIGNKTVLITHHISNKVGYYDFYLQNENKTLIQKGNIKYPEADSTKATALLDDILNNAQFTH